MPVRSFNSSVLKWPNREEVNRAVRRWAATFVKKRPEILRLGYFGSYARGLASPDSDVDLLVIGPFNGRGVDKSVEIQMKLRPSFPIYLLVRTPENVRDRIAIGDPFMQDTVAHGRILFDATESDAKSEGKDQE